MESAFVQVAITPGLVDLLDAVVSHLNAANILFGATGTETWKLDSPLECTTASLSRVRDTLRALYQIKDAATQIARAAEACIPVMKSKLMAIGLHSLPTEILRDIMYLSIVEDEALVQDAAFFLKRVLAVQSVCRYFRNVVQISPEFWTFLSSRNPQLFELQLERSKGRGLTLDIYAPHLREAGHGVSEIFRLHAGRWQSLRVDFPRSDFCEPVCESVSSLTFDRLTKLELRYKPSRDLPQEDLYTLESMAVGMPKLKHLRMVNRAPLNRIRAGLTTFSLLIEERFIHWSGRRLLEFIVSQNNLRNLSLHVRSKPHGTMQEFTEAIEERSFVGGRAMEVSIVLDKWCSTDALKSIWPALTSIGIGRLNIDLTHVDSNWQFRGLRHALYYASGKYAHELKTLEISLCPVVAYSLFYEENYDDRHELPSSLQVIRIRNCSLPVLCVMLPLLGRLLQRQETLGVTPFAKLVLMGQHPSEADCMAFVKLLGEDRVDCD